MNYDFLLETGWPWWSDEVDDNDRHERVSELVNRLKREQKYIDIDNVEHLRLYIKRDYSVDSEGSVQLAGANARIGINAVKSAIDTVCARITSQKPRPMFVTEGGRWDLRRKARKLQKFVEGVFHDQKYYRHARRAFKDAAVFGTGFVKFYFENGKIYCERVFPGEILVDEKAASDYPPNNMFQVKYVPIETIAAKFPDKKKEIFESSVRQNSVTDGVITSKVRVMEAWHLQQGDMGGKHCICVDGATLLCEDWKHDFFPILPIRWNELPVGYYGNGAAEDLAGTQEEIDYLMERIQRSMHLNANAWLMKHISDKAPNDQFTNEIGSIIYWSGEHPPDLKIMPALHQQVFDHVRWLHELVFDDTGVSQMSATSRKPKGVESGIALQTLLDVESQRFQLVLEAWEDLAVDSASVIIAMAKEHYRGGKSEFAVKYDSGRFVESIKWSDVNMAEDEYVLKKWPTNLLPSQPAGRIEYVERMIQSGLIDSQTGFMLLDFPDVEDYQALALAALKNALWTIDQVIYEDNYIKPRVWHDLQLGIRHMQMGLARAEMEGAPEEVLEQGIRWIADANDLLNPPMPPAPPPEMGMGMGAPAPAIDPATGLPLDLPPPKPMGGPPANLGNVPPAGTIVPGTM